MADTNSFALGFIETQGFTAVFEAIDSACKAANVEVLGKEKLGGRYITVIIKGDVDTLQAAIESRTTTVQRLGTPITRHVIPRPTPASHYLTPQSLREPTPRARPCCPDPAPWWPARSRRGALLRTPTDTIGSPPPRRA